jgi:16S rRNA (cytosine967-C5)-methyltransferase
MHPDRNDKTVINARAVAIALLTEVLSKGQPLDEVMARHDGLNQLERRDRAFAHAMTAMVLRRLGQIDALITACLNEAHQLKAPVQQLLRVGAAQLLFLNTPPHAAVDSMVELAAATNATQPYKGLINAVLRRLVREGASMAAAQDAARLNTPDWLWLSWRQAYGVATARRLAEALLQEAPLDISVKADAADWAEKLPAELLPTGSLRRRDATQVTELPGFAAGAWWVQDAAAVLPVKLLGDVAGQRVLDLCAAPGGKTAQLAALGANVTAVDRSAKRLERLKDNVRRLGFSVAVVCQDALNYRPEEKFPFILLDAPCSATGTIRRHPDAQRLKTPEDVTRMADLQRRLLDHALTLLSPGGTLVYAVCSMQPEEGEQQIAAALQRHPQLQRRPINAAEVGGCAEFVTADGNLRTLPSHWPAQGGLDGFFAARLSHQAIESRI